GEGAVVADVVDQLDRLLEVGLGLAWKPDDYVRGQGAVGNVLADHRHSVEVALTRVGAAHALEHAARSGLQREVDVLAQRRQLGVRTDHVLAHVLRMRARIADAVDAVDRVDAAQELGERRSLLAGEVAAVGIHVLPEQRDLADAIGGQPFHFGHQLVPGSADLTAPGGGHDAVGADAVAADADLDPGVVLTGAPG